MEDMIRKIVETDSALRARVAEREEELQALKGEDLEADEMRGSVHVQAQQEADELLARACAQAGAVDLQAETEYQAAEAKLRRIFDENRNTWIRAITDNCLERGAEK